MHVLEPLLFHARLQPEATALCVPGRNMVTYGQLAEQMNNVARRALSFGLRPGSVVALSIEEPLAHAVVILGLTLAGMVTASVMRGRPPRGLKFDGVISNNLPSFVPGVPALPLDLTWFAGTGKPVEMAPSSIDAADQACRIVFTSGTTGSAKAVALSHRIVLARTALYGRLMPKIHSRLFSSMPLANGGSMDGLAGVLGAGATIYFATDKVEDTLRSFEAFRMEAMGGSPAILAHLLDSLDRFPELEYQFDTMVTGGGMLRPSLVRRLRPRLCRHLYNAYGSTEAGMCAFAPAQQIADIPGAVGYVVPGARIEIVDENDRAVPANAEGIIRTATEYAVSSYVNAPEHSSRVFRDGWVYPGDTGSLTPDNLLIVSGRQEQVLNVGGGKLALEKLEAALSSFAGVTEAAALIEPGEAGIEEVWAALVSPGKIDLEALRTHCRSRVPPVFVPARAVQVEALPVNESGKIDRDKLRQMVFSALAVH